MLISLKIWANSNREEVANTLMYEINFPTWSREQKWMLVLMLLDSDEVSFLV